MGCSCSQAGAASFVEGREDTARGPVPLVKTQLEFCDNFGNTLRRLSIGRAGYTVPPGLYGVGSPSEDSPVLVSANYKLSFDALRKELGGVDAWILVIDTKGINVWCAAGKGTFGTDELVARVVAVGLGEIVSHRTLVVPQLGAPGVSAHEVKERCGFRVAYGPVRAADLPEFLGNRMKADPRMRRVRFTLWDRAAVAPVELVQGLKPALFIASVFFFLSGLGSSSYFSGLVDAGIPSALLIVGAFVLGSVAAPLLLPWLPGSPFSLKGAWVGAGFFALMYWVFGGTPGVFDGWMSTTAWLLMITAISSFTAMNFTGASTYTSLSGVKMEMKIAVPAQAAAAAVGIILWVVSRFV